MFEQQRMTHPVDIRRYVIAALANGNNIWMVDGTGTYRMLGRFFAGEVLTFDEEHPINLNPFGQVVDIQESLPILTMLLAFLGDPDLGCCWEQLLVLQHAIARAFALHHQHTTITDVVEALQQTPSTMAVPSQQMLIASLLPYTRGGRYGDYFESHRHLKTTRSLVVFDLVPLEHHKDLAEMVVALLVACFALGSAGKGYRTCFVDEKWSYGSGFCLHYFMQRAHKLAKHHYSALVTTSYCSFEAMT